MLEYFINHVEDNRLRQSRMCAEMRAVERADSKNEAGQNAQYIGRLCKLSPSLPRHTLLASDSDR